MSDARDAPDPGRLIVAADERLARRLSVEVERSVDAPIDEVWSVLCDYEYARPRMLPEHFAHYAVQDGGQGAGTVIAFMLRVGRRERRYVATVAEPMPGRQLRERDHGSGLVVTWTLTPAATASERWYASTATAGWDIAERVGRCAAHMTSCSPSWTHI